jgi:hypothetical protein
LHLGIALHFADRKPIYTGAFGSVSRFFSFSLIIIFFFACSFHLRSLQLHVLCMKKRIHIHKDCGNCANYFARRDD